MTVNPLHLCSALRDRQYGIPLNTKQIRSHFTFKALKRVTHGNNFKVSLPNPLERICTFDVQGPLVAYTTYFRKIIVLNHETKKVLWNTFITEGLSDNKLCFAEENLVLTSSEPEDVTIWTFFKSATGDKFFTFRRNFKLLLQVDIIERCIIIFFKNNIVEVTDIDTKKTNRFLFRDLECKEITTIAQNNRFIVICYSNLICIYDCKLEEKQTYFVPFPVLNVCLKDNLIICTCNDGNNEETFDKNQVAMFRFALINLSARSLTEFNIESHLIKASKTIIEDKKLFFIQKFGTILIFDLNTFRVLNEFRCDLFIEIKEEDINTQRIYTEISINNGILMSSYVKEDNATIAFTKLENTKFQEMIEVRNYTHFLLREGKFFQITLNHRDNNSMIISDP